MMIDESDDSFPLTSDRYEIRAGLRPLRRKLFHIGDDFVHYRKSKTSARAERLEKYFQLCRFSDIARRRLQSFLIDRLLADFPNRFQIEHGEGSRVLSCHHTGDRLRFDAHGNFLDTSTDTRPKYADGIDALAMQVEDDLTVMQRRDGVDAASVIHLCSPNHWAAEDKIGKPFDAIHEPVADMDSINSKSRQLVEVMIRAVDGLERTAWGISTDRELNRHPHSSADGQLARQFDPAHPVAFLRIEQQAMIGFPDIEALLFTIHTTFTDCASIRQNESNRQRLVSVLRSMSPATAFYKGILDNRSALITWLESDRLPS